MYFFFFNESLRKAYLWDSVDPLDLWISREKKILTKLLYQQLPEITWILKVSLIWILNFIPKKYIYNKLHKHWSSIPTNQKLRHFKPNISLHQSNNRRDIGFWINWQLAYFIIHKLCLIVSTVITPWQCNTFFLILFTWLTRELDGSSQPL